MVSNSRMSEGVRPKSWRLMDGEAGENERENREEEVTVEKKGEEETVLKRSGTGGENGAVVRDILCPKEKTELSV
ncbi:Hypothetical predicted protein [Octopus vulgaris]|uniref:Uncharacterized protein n=1 Tax=Octopus vulgaris TaxID=6645 RepID=A0AA36BIK8_OCTVU|nr:Hypothetical predicted protein [Octopus vulgaris]